MSRRDRRRSPGRCLVTDQVGRVGEALDVVLLENHGFLRTGSCGLDVDKAAIYPIGYVKYLLGYPTVPDNPRTIAMRETDPPPSPAPGKQVPP